MASLEIPITTITDPGLHVDVTVPADALKPADVAAIPLKTVAVRGTLSPLVGQYLFQGSVEAVFEHPCDRCLETAEFHVPLPVVWTFEEGAAGARAAAEDAETDEVDEEAYGLYTFDGTAIDLGRPAWEEAALALPVKFVCREDCKGLCPVCGGNRNSSPCACEKLETDETPASNSGFAGLKDMFPDLPD